MTPASAAATIAPEASLVFPCGGDELLGILHAGERNRESVGIVVVVGGPQYRVGSHRQFVLMARALAAAGYPVLRFDYRGMGDSGGEPRTFEHVSDDIRAAIDALLKNAPAVRRVVLWGLCDAASAALMYCKADSRIAGLILANPWVRTAEGQARSYLRHYYVRRLLQRSFWAKVLSGEWNVRKSMRDLSTTVRDAGKQSSTAAAAPFIDVMLDGLTRFVGPVLVLMSERDLTAQEFRDRCATYPAWKRAIRKTGVTVHELPDADHTFSTRPALDAATRSSLEWLDALRAQPVR
jgi:uncharacterized protein